MTIASMEAVITVTSVKGDTWTIEGKKFLPRKPNGMREVYDGALACQHRDVSVCDECTSTIANLVDVGCQQYWVRDYAEWLELVGELCEIAAEYA